MKPNFQLTQYYWMKLKKNAFKKNKKKKTQDNRANHQPRSWDLGNPIEKKSQNTILNQPNVEELNWKKYPESTQVNLPNSDYETKINIYI
jgi:hypothetical protein